MTTQRWTKIANDDIGYIKTNRNILEPRSAGVAKIFPDIGFRKPHCQLWFPDGSSSVWLDYDQVGFGGSPPRNYDSSAVVRWTLDGQTKERPSEEECHMIWSTEKISENWLESGVDGFRVGDHWALCKDTWTGSLHWLSYNFEQQITVADGTSHKVILENIGLENNLQDSKEI
jgi:hypothetical protein